MTAADKIFVSIFWHFYAQTQEKLRGPITSGCTIHLCVHFSRTLFYAFNMFGTMKFHLSSGMGSPTMWYVPPAKPPISLRMHTIRSEPLLVA